ncbi:DnaA ATPase domain-containing protein [Asticcacaulis sp. 201]|uniref:DnaA ATPase domain-containing protein n=1 Tax=Asticcacaulis sp. 201 TaxID=3028787 RepID=UPI0029165E5A|nr:DnaA/Hda family protein [Asticcacaulis sp. 201]MDV6329479.1 DnaA/Hda family protein [Asticcacaulis sp. 201]
MSTQLPLDLEAADRFSRDNFIATTELAALMGVLLHRDQWLSPHLILLGPEGSGKTHLGHIFAETSQGRFLTADDTYALDHGTLENVTYVVDDAENASEEALFHLCNHVQKTAKQLVLLTENQPIAWDVHLPDLASRLNAMRIMTLPEPDEDLLIAILNKLFAQRAISPSPDFIDYIARRMDRSVSAAQKIVTELEHYANGRPFNRALAKSFFEQNSDLFDADV